MKCRECDSELQELTEMDEYRLCHPCYCQVMDTGNTDFAEKRSLYKQLAEATKGEGR